MNLELIIKGERWNIKIENNPAYMSYWRVDTSTRTLTVHNYDLEKAKLECYLQYKEKE